MTGRGRPGRRAAAMAVVAALVAAGATGCGGRATTHHKPGTSHEQAVGSVGTLLAADDGAGHRLRQVPAEGAPQVRVTVHPDTEDGWNLELTVQDFHFTPDSTGGAAVPGGGHAHLELDGRKLARLYGPWFHLPAAQVPRGTHTLTVRLYADDHTAWAVDGRPVQAAATVTGTGASGGAGHTHAGAGAGGGGTSGAGAGGAGGAGSGGAGDGGAVGAVDRTVTVTVRAGRVDPAPGRVGLRRGQRVALRVTSDTADTLHVHGYDKELDLPAGRTVALVLTVDRTGLFEVETHESELVLTQLLVR
ncbi:hypothetical protein [Streptomyces sp. NRRL S-87]|uniref:hypothetical protein n=1 Tax=Streptomyces sp. NRRL S-87 TaxID=1463920 RepID=UPI0004BF735D|nr:hypothetical protein [Streptomyces sp. NRRL S-87]